MWVKKIARLYFLAILLYFLNGFLREIFSVIKKV